MKEGIHYAREIEAAVLGICLLEKDAIGRVYGNVKPEMFYYKDNQVVCETLLEMYANNTPIDHLTVWQKMTQDDKKLLAGNACWYLSGLSMHVVSSAHLEYHIHLIETFWRKRELETITRSGIDSTLDPAEQAKELKNRLTDLMGIEVKKDWQSLDELYCKLLLHQNEIKEGKTNLITTGFKGIDRINGGFSPGQLIVIGARPSVGKSALMNKIAVAIAKQDKPVGIVSLEMNNTEIAARLASIQSETSFSIIYRNLFNDENEREIFYGRLQKNRHLPIHVSDKTKTDVTEIRAKAMKLRNKEGLSCIIVDYLQLVDGATSKNYNREQEVAKISRGLKLMAMEMEIPVIVLCQLNRSSTTRKGKDRYPQLSDLRESGAIEQDADVVMMLHRDWIAGYPTHPDTGASTELSADLLGLKWRNGAMFHLELDFEPKLMKFSEKYGSQFIPVHISEPSEDNDPF